MIVEAAVMLVLLDQGNAAHNHCPLCQLYVLLHGSFTNYAVTHFNTDTHVEYSIAGRLPEG